MVLVKKWPFFQLFFLGNIGQENVFYDILERKNAFPPIYTVASSIYILIQSIIQFFVCFFLSVYYLWLV